MGLRASDSTDSAWFRTNNLAIPYAKSGYSTETSGYVDNPIPKQCSTCEYFREKNLCSNDVVRGDSALFTDPKSGLKLVSPTFGCCNEWEPEAAQPTNVLYIVRHGETKLNAAHAFRGNVDVDIDAKGIRQAEEARTFLSGIPFGRFLSSTKRRAVHSIEVIIGESRSFETTEQLCALNVGKFSGQPKNAANLKELEYYISHPEIPIPGGESLQAFQNRVRPVLKEAMMEGLVSGKPTFILGHSSIVHEVGSMLHGDPESILVEPGGVAVIFQLASGKFDARAILHPKPQSVQTDVVS